MKRSLVLTAFGVLLVALAIANAAGYRYGVSDQAFYIPSILDEVNPALYPRDTNLLEAQGRFMVADEMTGWVLRRTGVPLEPLMLAGHVASLVLLMGSVWVLSRRLSASAWTAAACCAAATLRHRITETGANTFEGYYHPRGLAFACGAAAAAAWSHDRVALAWACVAVSVVMHPTTGLWWALWLGGVMITALPRWRRLAPALAVGGVVAGGALLWFTPLGQALRVMDPQWIAPFASKDYVFPTAWPVHAWLLNLLLPVVVVAAWRWRVARGLAAPWEQGVVGGVLVLTLLFLASLPFIAARLAIAVQLQTSRVFWLMDLFAVMYAVWAIAEATRVTMPSVAMRRRPVVVAGVLLSLSALRGFYSLTVEHPERPFVRLSLEDSAWVRTGQWLAARTPTDTHVLADPGHDWKYGHSVRITAHRDVLVEGVKDAAVSLYDRQVALGVQSRIDAIGDFATLDAAKAVALARRFDIDVLVIDRALPLPELHRDGPFRVYRLQ